MQEKKLDRKPHEGRDDLTGEHKFGDAGQFILFLVFFVVWIFDCFIFEFSYIVFDAVSLIIRIPVSIAVLILAGYLARTSVKIVFEEVKEKPQVINRSVFKYVRHPMYLASILLYLAFLIFKFSLAAFIVWIFTFLFYTYIAKYEEKLLLEQFGEEYENYRKSVSMWIPNFKK